MQPVSILGSGSWGTALGWLLASKGLPVTLWGRDPGQAERMAASRLNERYLPDLRLPNSLTPTSDLSAAADARVVVLAVPASAVRSTVEAVRPLLAPGTGLLLAAKGLERETGRRLSEVVREVLGAEFRLAVLSGPNLSGEIIRGVPTATVIGSEDEAYARELQELFGTPSFRVYTNADVTGVELGGALKNPIAIAAGISDGLGYGNNTKAALLTRGLAEITRLGVAAGGRTETFSGLSGLGDLLATANSPLSRNYRVGLALGRGETLESAREALHQVAEGVPTTDAACRLARSLGVDAPILHGLRAVLYDGHPVASVVSLLLARPLKTEHGDA